MSCFQSVGVTSPGLLRTDDKCRGAAIGLVRFVRIGIKAVEVWWNVAGMSVTEKILG